MTDRVLLGPLGGGAYGLKVSRPGYDVNNALVDEELSFDSRWLGAMRLKASGSFTGTGGSVTSMFGLTLSAPPVALVFYKQSGRYWGQFYSSFTSGDVPIIRVLTDRIVVNPATSGLVYTWFAFLP